MKSMILENMALKMLNSCNYRNVQNNLGVFSIVIKSNNKKMHTPNLISIWSIAKVLYLLEKNTNGLDRQNKTKWFRM